MEAVKRVVESLPFPFVAGLALIVAVAWSNREYNAYGNYSTVLQNRMYQSFVVIVVFDLQLITRLRKCYIGTFRFSRMTSRGFFFGNREFLHQVAMSTILKIIEPSEREVEQT